MAKKRNQQSVLQMIADRGDYLLTGAVFALLLIMMVPLPPFILDILLASSVTMSLLMFITVLVAQRPLDISVFPTLLLIATIFRLSLNVASTRLILLKGGEGSASAGKVIEAFGQFVVGGNYIVGFVVFIILVVINFIVITKGSGRVAEVAARFTLDAMPGKQMAIDADMNNGVIDEGEARRRRKDISAEAEFYGAMDGASKFVRGDAIAGIVITVVNIIGGLFIGIFQLGMPMGEALTTYTILTIGDGLAGQIPALIVSVSAGLLITRVNEDDGDVSFHGMIGRQLFGNPRVLSMLCAAMICFAFVPGLRLPFGILAIVAGYGAWLMAKEEPEKQKQAQKKKDETGKGGNSVPKSEARPEDLLPIEPLCVEMGLDLLYLVDDRKGGELVQRIQRIRNQFATDLGVVLPPVHLRDNLRMEAGEYRFLLKGELIGRGTLQARQNMALDPGGAIGTLRGVKAIDPVFGLPAYWVPDSGVLEAQTKGFTVVDVPTVLTTHLVELLHEYAHELYEGSQLAKTLERVSAKNPKLVDDLTPDPLARATLLKIFRSLIREGVSIRDMETILETLTEYASKTRNPDILTEFVRQRQCRHITHRFADEEGTVHYIALGPQAEDAILRNLQSAEGEAPSLVLDPSEARDIFIQVRDLTEAHAGAFEAVLLCPPLARGAIRRMFERVLPRIPILSSAELLPTTELDCIGTVELGTA